MSVFRTALGDDWHRLHPQLRRRFDITAGGTSVVGTGVMDEVWRGPAFTVPFLALGSRRHIGFPDVGRDVPFTVENYGYRDRFGREAVTFVRTFDLPRRRRRFDATMVWSDAHGTLVDYLGTHQHLATDLALRVDDTGGLHIRTGPQRFRAGPVDAQVPRFLLGIGDVHEWYDDTCAVMRIDVQVNSPRFGRLFGYHGSFTVRTLDAAGPVPAAALPVRAERRE
jgi:hypothetical protein